jgi:hypothetical protein
MPPPPIDPNAVFLNFPYDEQFQSLYVAYVVGLCWPSSCLHGLTGGTTGDRQ